MFRERFVAVCHLIFLARFLIDDNLAFDLMTVKIG
jgi:hypothetical protein